MTRITRKQTLRSLSLSYQKKDGRAWSSPSFFWYDTDFSEFDSADIIDYILENMRTHPSFGMTTTKTLRSVFSWLASNVTYMLSVQAPRLNFFLSWWFVLNSSRFSAFSLMLLLSSAKICQIFLGICKQVRLGRLGSCLTQNQHMGGGHLLPPQSPLPPQFTCFTDTQYFPYLMTSKI